MGFFLPVGLKHFFFYYRFVFWDPQFRSALPSGSDSSILPASLGRRQVGGAHQGLPWDAAFAILLLRAIGECWGLDDPRVYPGELLLLNIPPLGVVLSFVIGSSLGTGPHVFRDGLKQ